MNTDNRMRIFARNRDFDLQWYGAARSSGECAADRKAIAKLDAFAGMHRFFRALVFALFLIPFAEAPVRSVQAPTGQTSLVRVAFRDGDADGIPDRMGESVTLIGVITSEPRVPGRRTSWVNFQDSSGGTLLSAQQSSMFMGKLDRGDRIQATGTIDLYHGMRRLRVTGIQRLGKGDPPAAKDVLIGDLLDGRHSGRLVRASGELVVPPDYLANRRAVMLHDRTGAIRVYVSDRFLERPEFVNRLRQGGKVDLTGIAAQSKREPRADLQYSIRPRDADDFSFSPVPPYRAIGVAAAFSLLIALAGYLSYRRRLAQHEIRKIARLTEKLRSAEALYHSLVQSLPVCVFRKDLDGRFTFANDQFCAALSKSAQEIIGNTDCDFYPSELAVKYRNDDRRVIEIGEEFEFEEENRKPDGRPTFVHAIKSPIRTPEGTIAGLQCVFWDITEKKRSEEAILEQARLLDLVPGAVMVWNQEGRITYWSKGAEQLYGWSANEARGRAVMELYEEDASAFPNAKAILQEKGGWSGELCQITRKGVQIIVESRMTRVNGFRGHKESYLVINSDITEKKNLETQFLRAQRMESIGTLAGGIAHDLNNILAPISMATEILSRKFPAPEAKRVLNILETNIRRASDLVKQVLTFGRGLKGERVPTQMKHVMQEIVKIARETFPKNIRIESEVPSDLWVVEGDATQLHQILLNLSVNARDAMPNGGRLLIKSANFEVDEHYASMARGAKAGAYIVVEFTDTGAGIPPAILERIFDPFFTTKEHGNGTGLGLSTVLGIVKGHDGFIQVRSKPGEGSTFKVFLPASAKRAKKAETNGEIAQTIVPGGDGETILVVDDEPHIRDLAETILTSHGYKVLLAEEGTDGIATFAQHQLEIKAVVTDIMMPHMDGMALARALKCIDPNVEIIASSGLPSGFEHESSITELESVGIRMFLQKPYKGQQLLRALHETLRKR